MFFKNKLNCIFINDLSIYKTQIIIFTWESFNKGMDYKMIQNCKVGFIHMASRVDIML